MLDLDCLFPKSTMPRDVTDSLQAVADLMSDISPSLIMLCRSDGQVIALDGSEYDLVESDVAALEDALPVKLAVKRLGADDEGRAEAGLRGAAPI